MWKVNPLECCLWLFCVSSSLALLPPPLLITLVANFMAEIDSESPNELDIKYSSFHYLFTSPITLLYNALYLIKLQKYPYNMHFLRLILNHTYLTISLCNSIIDEAL